MSQSEPIVNKEITKATKKNQVQLRKLRFLKHFPEGKNMEMEQTRTEQGRDPLNKCPFDFRKQFKYAECIVRKAHSIKKT